MIKKNWMLVAGMLLIAIPIGCSVVSEEAHNQFVQHFTRPITEVTLLEALFYAVVFSFLNKIS